MRRAKLGQIETEGGVDPSPMRHSSQELWEKSHLEESRAVPPRPLPSWARAASPFRVPKQASSHSWQVGKGGEKQHRLMGRVSMSGILEQRWGRKTRDRVSVVINCIYFHVRGHASQDGNSSSNYLGSWMRHP